MFKNSQFAIYGNIDIGPKVKSSLEAAGAKSALVDMDKPDILLRAPALILIPEDNQSLWKTLDFVRCFCRDRRSSRREALQVIVFRFEPEPNDRITRGVECDEEDKIVVRSLFVYPQVASNLLRRYPLHASSDVAAGQQLNLVIYGSTKLAQSIALQAMYIGHYSSGPLKINLVPEDDSPARKASFLTYYQKARNFCELSIIDGKQLEFGLPHAVSSNYICMNDDKRAIDVSHWLRTILRKNDNSSPIYLHLDNFEGFSDASEWDAQTFPFSALNEICHPKDLLKQTGDELAEEIHNYYLDSIQSQGRDLSETASGRPWSMLEDSYKAACRHQADHMEAKLVSIDCRSVPDAHSDSFSFSGMEVEKLARIEHDRWCADRYLGGWVYAPIRDDLSKHHPCLVPYNKLDKAMKDLDRYAP